MFERIISFLVRFRGSLELGRRGNKGFKKANLFRNGRRDFRHPFFPRPESGKALVSIVEEI
jgi:hypothetical protein